MSESVYRLPGATAQAPGLGAFLQAQQFYFAGRRCLWEVPVGPRTNQWLPIAAALNLLLSAELSFKAAMATTGVKPKPTHSLKALGESAPERFLGRARAIYDSLEEGSSFDDTLAYANGQLDQAPATSHHPATMW